MGRITETRLGNTDTGRCLVVLGVKGERVDEEGGRKREEVYNAERNLDGIVWSGWDDGRTKR